MKWDKVTKRLRIKSHINHNINESEEIQKYLSLVKRISSGERTLDKRSMEEFIIMHERQKSMLRLNK
ncbi:hypothetical protein O9G_000483 [Rozella allomycis CSF55]|uniref:Uncharacterized protein n=1 Tax=Rozella allomycis (strain CSF55) TaxID=988480 RepID=A0A075AYC0_ROZAC|nr:hypothetical protein O9G_000483 [Rozella allomycis CSF55]|eukprot:EPZ33707.1 hypothetical protein O9G_000483 [Rozella allomycis CSF55]